VNLPLADSLLYQLAHWQARRYPVQPIEAFQAGAVRRVLVVLSTGMGDAILSTPVLPVLRQGLPQAEIRLFCRAAWTPLFENDPDLDGLIVYAGKYRRFFSTLRALRTFAPELVVVLHGNDPDILPLCALSGARFIVRIPTTGTRHTSLLSNRSRSSDASTLPGLHYIENRLRILDTLGLRTKGIEGTAGTEATEGSLAPRIHLQATRAAEVVAQLRQRIQSQHYWVMHPCAADPYKVWPMAKARALLEQARQRWPQLAIVLTGSRHDAATLQQLAQGLDGVFNTAGALDIAQTGAVLQQARCVLAPDTGVAHLAAALDTPVVALYAATDARLIGVRPRHAATVILQQPQTCTPCIEKRCNYTGTTQHCMEQISLQSVLHALQSVLPDTEMQAA
jgi:ADP-heptose:LPS heptosyltransferase